MLKRYSFLIFCISCSINSNIDFRSIISVSDEAIKQSILSKKNISFEGIKIRVSKEIYSDNEKYKQVDTVLKYLKENQKYYKYDRVEYTGTYAKYANESKYFKYVGIGNRKLIELIIVYDKNTTKKLSYWEKESIAYNSFRFIYILEGNELTLLDIEFYRRQSNYTE